jgi:hypothetical protein
MIWLTKWRRPFSSVLGLEGAFQRQKLLASPVQMIKDEARGWAFVGAKKLRKLMWEPSWSVIFRRFWSFSFFSVILWSHSFALFWQLCKHSTCYKIEGQRWWIFEKINKATIQIVGQTELEVDKIYLRKSALTIESSCPILFVALRAWAAHNTTRTALLINHVTFLSHTRFLGSLGAHKSRGTHFLVYVTMSLESDSNKQSTGCTSNVQVLWSRLGKFSNPSEDCSCYM